jgi:hypothetical protein
MDPLSLLCRLVTSVPPPRFHTVHYAGVLAAASEWRSRLAPASPLPARAEGDEPHRRMRSGRNTRVFVGSYDFHLQRVADGWRIDLFRSKVKFIDGNRDLENEPGASMPPVAKGGRLSAQRRRRADQHHRGRL